MPTNLLEKGPMITHDEKWHPQSTKSFCFLVRNIASNTSKDPAKLSEDRNRTEFYPKVFESICLHCLYIQAHYVFILIQ